MGAEDSIGIVCVSASFAARGLSHSGCCCDGVLGRSGTSTRSTDFGCNAVVCHTLQINVIAQRIAVPCNVHIVHATMHREIERSRSIRISRLRRDRRFDFFNDPYAQPAQFFARAASYMYYLA